MPWFNFLNPNSFISFVTSFCKNNTLDPNLINGKIVICTIERFTDNRREKAIIIRQGGGVGMILIDHNAKDVGFQFVIPSTLIGQDAVEELQAYINTDKWVLFKNLQYGSWSHFDVTKIDQWNIFLLILFLFSGILLL